MTLPSPSINPPEEHTPNTECDIADLLKSSFPEVTFDPWFFFFGLMQK